MEPLIGLLIHILVFCLVFGLLYWVVVLVVGILPAPVQNPVRVILFIILALLAISFILSEAGFIGDYGAFHRHRLSMVGPTQGQLAGDPQEEWDPGFKKSDEAAKEWLAQHPFATLADPPLGNDHD
jgi:hypothetical protein